MRSPKAVNRSHSRHVFSVNSARGKGEAAKRRLATKKKWQHSLLGLNPYATKAAIVFATFDLKVAEADRLNKFLDEQQAEKSSTSAQMKAEKELQNKAKKEREAAKKQQKQERKKIADAARKEEEEKLAKSNVATHLTKESENKNSTNTCEPFSEESIKNLSKESSKKNKKNKKKFESGSNLVNEEVMVARNIEPTETPKNTPVDTPAEAPTTPAEYDFDVGKVPMVIEEVNVELDKTANNMNTTHSQSASETMKNVDAVNNKTDDEFEFVEHEEVQVCSSFNKSKKNKRNKKKSHTEPSSAAHTFSSTPVPEEHATTEDTTEPTHTIIDERDQQNNSKVSELEYSSVIPDNKEAVNVMNQVISTSKDELDKIVQDAPKTIAPIQVNEVTSTETDSDGQKIYRSHISAAVELDSVTNPTHFAQNVQKLVNSTLSASDFDLNDPNMKMTVQAQLVKITEKEKKPTIVYEHKPITLAYERQRTVFERPSRERIYKLLNRDIVFCSSMIDVYGEDYESMAKDEKNVYRETARSIQRKIRIFKESPHYSVYLEAKALGKDVSELLSEETL